MKKVLLYIPIVLSFVTLGAHFMRYGSTLEVIAVVVLIGLLFVRRPWVARLMQVVLVLGAIQWVHTLYDLAQLRIAFGQPATRLVIILGTVAAVTLGSALLFQTKALKKIYRL
jgi:hypothetical protein